MKARLFQMSFKICYHHSAAKYSLTREIMPQHEHETPADSIVAEKVIHDPEFLALIKKKNTISFSLTALMLLIYFGFAALLAYAPEVLAAPVGNATLGIPLGIGVIIIACVLTGIYVFWANTKYDSLIAHLNARLKDKGDSTQ